MRKTAMQNLKEDLLETIITGKEAFDKIQDVNIKSACKTTLETTIKDIINRIDNELLEEEKDIITEAYSQGRIDEETRFPYATNGEDYFKLEFTQSSEQYIC